MARAFRKRDKILKFEGGFHGMHDYSLMSAGPRAPKAFPAPTPDTAGIPRCSRKAAGKFYVSLAHGDAEVRQPIEVFKAALRAVATAHRPAGARRA